MHLVGIGGAGLSGIARLLLARGVEVSGSDGVASPTLDALRDLGATVHVGHDPRHLDHLGAGDTVVVSTAVKRDNPEYVEATARHLGVISRAAAMAALMEGRRVVAVAGTHGKTTTTSLLTIALQAAGADPTYTIGGDLAATGVNAAEGTGTSSSPRPTRATAPSSSTGPYAAIVTNVEADHLDHWGTERGLRGRLRRVRGHPRRPTASSSAASTTPERPPWPSGSGPPGAGSSPCPPGPGSPTSARTRSTASRSGRRVTTTWRTPSRRTPRASTLGLDGRDLKRGLASYTGTRRRMEPKGEAGECASTTAMRTTRPRSPATFSRPARSRGTARVVVAFQPHMVSRTRAFGAAMGRRSVPPTRSSSPTSTWLARTADPAVTGALVAEAVPLPPERVALRPRPRRRGRGPGRPGAPGDLVLTLGAGDITDVGPQVLALLAERADG